MAWNGETIDELRGALARGATTSEQLTDALPRRASPRSTRG